MSSGIELFATMVPLVPRSRVSAGELIRYEDVYGHTYQVQVCQKHIKVPST